MEGRELLWHQTSFKKPDAAKDPKRKTLAKQLEEEENLLKQSIDKLKIVEANRVSLVSQLREALNEQVYHSLLASGLNIVPI